MLSITVVSASRYDKDDFYLHSALGRSLSQTYQNFPIKQKIYFNNSKPLPVCYNDAISSVTEPEEIMVFVHDDVLIVDFFWIDKLILGFQRFNILGLAGNIRRVPRQPSWAFINDSFVWDQPSNLSGAVGHGREFPCALSLYGQIGQRCKLLDGVFLASKKSTIEKNAIRFDERFSFHFYDLDFCRQAEEKNVSMGTIPLGIVHQSVGAFGSPQWKNSCDLYLAKWKE